MSSEMLPIGEVERFVHEAGVALRRALVARYGIEAGADAAADALAWAVEHWPELSAMANPTGYLYRVGQTSAKRQHRWQRPDASPTVATTLRFTGLDPVAVLEASEEFVQVVPIPPLVTRGQRRSRSRSARRCRSATRS